MGGVFGICNTLGGLTNLILIDRVGRRKLFLAGLSGLSVWLGVFAACTELYAQTNATSKYAPNKNGPPSIIFRRMCL